MNELTLEKVFNDLEKYCYFEAPYYRDFFFNESYFINNVIKALKDNYVFNGHNWHYDSGASKGVIIIDNFSYVIKIPFMGGNDYYDCSYDTIRESRIGKTHYSSDDYTHISPEAQYYPFCGAKENCDEIERDWDYCELENYIYNKAVEEGLETCFAATKILGFINDYPIYYQPTAIIYCQIENSKMSKINSDSTKRGEAIRAHSDTYIDERIPSVWLGEFLEFFGEQMFNKLFHFINEYNLSDFHYGNMGYIDNIPVLVDYSGFGS